MQENQQQQNQEQKSKPLFLVSSAIHTRFGVYKKYERLNQTIETCKSIRERVADADIYILDGGEKELSSEEKEMLSPHIDGFYSFADAENVKQVQKVPNQDIVKNMIEIIMFGSFFDMMQKEGWAEKYNRVFKISGRYTLNEHFNLQAHMDAKDQVVIRGPYTSQFAPDITGGIRLQYMSRLWSFDISLLDYVNATYFEMFKHMHLVLDNGGYVDIEHLLFDHIDAKAVKSIGVLGIQGHIAPNGNGVED